MKDSGPHSRRQHVVLILGAGLMAAGVSYLIDVVVPALPAVAEKFDVDAARAQWVLAAALIGVAIGQLFVGAISDAVGRRPVFLLGFVCFVLASIVAPFVQNFELLVVARFVQGLAISAGVVMSRAGLGDLFQGHKATRAFSLLSGILGIGPVMMPLLGALLLTLGGVSLTFAGISVIGVLVLAYIWRLVPESLPIQKRSAPQLRPMLAAYGRLFRNPAYWQFGIVVVLNHACIILYMGSASFITQNLLSLSPLGTSVVIGIGSLGMVGVGFLFARFGSATSSERVLWVVQIGVFAADSLFLVLVLTETVNPVLFTCWTVILMGSHAIVLAVGVSLSISKVQYGVGAATALIGSLQYGLGALIMPLGGAFGDSSALPLALGTLFLVGLSLTLRFLFGRIRRGA